MSFREELNEYRKAYGLVQQNVSAKMGGSQEQDPWSVQQQPQIPDGYVAPAWGDRIELPEEIPTFVDDRFTGNDEQDMADFQQYMNEHPFVQQEGAKLEQFTKELSDMVKDPNNPMTLEEAVKIYTQQFSAAYDEWNYGGSNA